MRREVALIAKSGRGFDLSAKAWRVSRFENKKSDAKKR